MNGADVFIGVSVGNCVSEDMVRLMAEKPIMFPCANPVPEINPECALKAGAYIVGTGSSQYPNQFKFEFRYYQGYELFGYTSSVRIKNRYDDRIVGRDV